MQCQLCFVTEYKAIADVYNLDVCFEKVDLLDVCFRLGYVLISMCLFQCGKSRGFFRCLFQTRNCFGYLFQNGKVTWVHVSKGSRLESLFQKRFAGGSIHIIKSCWETCFNICIQFSSKTCFTSSRQKHKPWRYQRSILMIQRILARKKNKQIWKHAS